MSSVGWSTGVGGLQSYISYANYEFRDLWNERMRPSISASENIGRVMSPQGARPRAGWPTRELELNIDLSFLPSPSFLPFLTSIATHLVQIGSDS